MLDSGQWTSVAEANNEQGGDGLLDQKLMRDCCLSAYAVRYDVIL